MTRLNLRWATIDEIERGSSTYLFVCNDPEYVFVIWLVNTFELYISWLAHEYNASSVCCEKVVPFNWNWMNLSGWIFVNNTFHFKRNVSCQHVDHKSDYSMLYWSASSASANIMIIISKEYDRIVYTVAVTTTKSLNFNFIQSFFYGVSRALIKKKNENLFISCVNSCNCCVLLNDNDTKETNDNRKSNQSVYHAGFSADQK